MYIVFGIFIVLLFLLTLVLLCRAWKRAKDAYYSQPMNDTPSSGCGCSGTIPSPAPSVHHDVGGRYQRTQNYNPPYDRTYDDGSNLTTGGTTVLDDDDDGVDPMSVPMAPGDDTTSDPQETAGDWTPAPDPVPESGGGGDLLNSSTTSDSGGGGSISNFEPEDATASGSGGGGTSDSSSWGSDSGGGGTIDSSPSDSGDGS